jgi:hypothetical protein
LMRDHNGPAGHQRGGFLVRELLKQFAPLHFTIFPFLNTGTACALCQWYSPSRPRTRPSAW